MPPINTKLKTFHVTFRAKDPFEHMVARAFSRLDYGKGKTVFLRLMKTHFGKCQTPEDMVTAINDAVDNVLSPRLIESIREHVADIEAPRRAAATRASAAIASTTRSPQWTPDVLAG